MSFSFSPPNSSGRSAKNPAISASVDATPASSSWCAPRITASSRSTSRANSASTTFGQIGVRGTKFDFSIDPRTNKTTVVLFEGEVSLCPKQGGCETVKGKCEIGLSETSNAELIKTGDSGHASASSKFPYVSSQRSLRSDFRVNSANNCGAQAPAVSEKKPEPKPDPGPNKPEGKPDPIPDPLPD